MTRSMVALPKSMLQHAFVIAQQLSIPCDKNGGTSLKLRALMNGLASAWQSNPTPKLLRPPILHTVIRNVRFSDDHQSCILSFVMFAGASDGLCPLAKSTGSDCIARGQIYSAHAPFWRSPFAKLLFEFMKTMQQWIILQIFADMQCWPFLSCPSSRHRFLAPAVQRQHMHPMSSLLFAGSANLAPGGVLQLAGTWIRCRLHEKHGPTTIAFLWSSSSRWFPWCSRRWN